MLSIFKSERRVLFCESASTAIRPDRRVAWKLRNRGSQNVEATDIASIPAFLGASGVELRVRGNLDGKSFGYFRGHFLLSPSECEGIVRLSLRLDLEHAAGVLVVASFFNDPDLSDEINSFSTKVSEDDGVQVIEFALNVSDLRTGLKTIYGFIQVCLAASDGALVRVGDLRVRQDRACFGYRKLYIRYDVFGDDTKASSRLRAWKFIELLKQEGHDVSVGDGGKDASIDLYFCQKVRPFSTVRRIRTANPNAVIIYDFDDNFILPEQGVLPEFLAFINLVDVVTCGSEYLAMAIRQWHHNIFVLENPLDVENDALCRTRGSELKRVGWFGAPEGMSELEKTDLSIPVSTLTKGGDIPFDLRSVDQDLMGFDLLVFPVEPTPWNLAKNANRMMKAVALGVPVLASKTPEQKRIAELIGLPEECLMPCFEGWDARVRAIEQRFAHIENATLAARENLWQSHSTRAILNGLFDHLIETTRLDRQLARRTRRSTEAFARIAVLVVDPSSSGHASATLSRSAVDWAGFHSVNVFSATDLSNELLGLSLKNLTALSGNFLSLFDEADKFVACCKAEYLLIIPAGTALADGAAGAIDEIIGQHSAPLALFARSGYFSHRLVGKFDVDPVREMLLRAELIGPLLARMDWVREANLRWNRSFELWSWVAVLKALTHETPVAMIELPFAFDVVERREVNVSRQYAEWLRDHDPNVSRELPDHTKQWGRVLSDIVAESAAAAGCDLAAAYAELYSAYVAQNHHVKAIERELKVIKATVTRATKR
jgi:hypothetical protein